MPRDCCRFGMTMNLSMTMADVPLSTIRLTPGLHSRECRQPSRDFDVWKMIIMMRSLLILVACSSATPLLAAAKPNIVIVLSDDMGFSDIGCYGGEIATPTLDGLASQGVRFTQFYNTARCCPTRASLLTGLYPHQAGMGHMTDDRGHDGYRGDLNQQCVTIAEVLRPAGYRTYMTGKWHVTKNLSAKTESDKHNWPLQRGFDRFYGTIIGGGSFWDPAFLTRDNTQVTAFADPEYRPREPYYYTDAISDHAVRYVQDHKAQHPDQPFFLYVAYTAAHWPMHAHEQDIAKYKGRYAAGYQAIRQQRYEKMLKLGVISKDATTVTGVPQGEQETPHWAWEQRNMEVFAAMVDRMDQGLGKLVETLKATGQLDNTLFCYLQDNGGCAENMGRVGDAKPRADQPTLPPTPPEEMRTALVPKQTRDGYPVRQGKGVMAGGPDTYIGYGEAWAAVSNTPFREYKHWVHEGGISTPLIVHWPAGMKSAARGTLRHEPGHLVDLMATCVDIAEAKYPGAPIKPLRGTSLRPAFDGEAMVRREPLFWEHEGNRAVRDDRWKLVAKENQPWELYDMAVDRSEQRDLSGTHPEKTSELAAQWDAYAASSDVLPLGTWRGNTAEAKSAKRVFELKADDKLPKNNAPQIAGRSFNIEADFTAAEKTTGVIVAHGGTAQGYALHVASGQLHFVVRRGGEMVSIHREITPGPQRAHAQFHANGKLSLQLNDGEATESEPGPLLQMPADGLQIGRDDAGCVGPYEGPNPFNGTIQQVRITLDPVLAASIKKTDASKRNVLFVMADDFRPELASYGSPAITPHLDRLAQRSLQFNRAYCQQAVCNPSRSSMLTGRRPDTLRIWNNGTHFREPNPDVTTLPLWFKEHGYTTRGIGKIFHNWHTKVHGDPRSWSAPEFLHYANHGDDVAEVAGPLPPNLSSPTPRMYGKVPLYECRDVPDEAYYDGRVAAEAVRVLGEIKDEPFFLAVGFWKPHAPFNAPKKYWDLYDRAKLPPLNPARPSDTPEVAFHDGREIRGAPPNQVTFTEAQVAEIRHGYFANISYLDAQLGKVLDALDRSGVADRTAIVFVGDHGYHVGEHTLWGKTSNFEYDAHVPLIISAPGMAASGKQTDALVEELDLFPTLVEVCGLPAPDGLEGKSLTPLFANPAATVKASAMTQHPRPAYYDREPTSVPQTMGYSVRTDAFRYTEWRDWSTGETVARELYDHRTDAAELRNLANHLPYANHVKTHAAALNAHHPLVKPGWKPPAN